MIIRILLIVAIVLGCGWGGLVMLRRRAAQFALYSRIRHAQQHEGGEDVKCAVPDNAIAVLNADQSRWLPFGKRRRRTIHSSQ